METTGFGPPSEGGYAARQGKTASHSPWSTFAETPPLEGEIETGETAHLRKVRRKCGKITHITDKKSERVRREETLSRLLRKEWTNHGKARLLRKEYERARATVSPLQALYNGNTTYEVPLPLQKEWTNNGKTLLLSKE